MGYANSPVNSYLLAFFATLFAIWLLIPIAHKIGFVDHPGGRKQHSHSIPLIGGIAIFFGFFFFLLFLPISLILYRSLFASSLILLLIGVADDIIEVKPKMRLITQIIAALIAAYWGAENLSYLGNLFFLGPLNLGLYGIL